MEAACANKPHTGMLPLFEEFLGKFLLKPADQRQRFLSHIRMTLPVCAANIQKGNKKSWAIGKG